MPKGVEHVRDDPPKFDPNVPPTSVMPKGVEHLPKQIRDEIWANYRPPL